MCTCSKIVLPNTHLFSMRKRRKMITNVTYVDFVRVHWWINCNIHTGALPNQCPVPVRLGVLFHLVTYCSLRNSCYFLHFLCFRGLQRPLLYEFKSYTVYKKDKQKERRENILSEPEVQRNLYRGGAVEEGIDVNGKSWPGGNMGWECPDRNGSWTGERREKRKEWVKQESQSLIWYQYYFFPLFTVTTQDIPYTKEMSRNYLLPNATYHLLSTNILLVCSTHYETSHWKLVVS